MASSSDKKTIEILLRQAAEGDQNAWRDIVEMYAPRVFGLIRAKCSDADLAEEIAQSTFCTIAAKITSYTELGKFEPWLFRIAMNRLRDEMRRRKRHAVSVDEETLIGLAGSGGGKGGGGAGKSSESVDSTDDIPKSQVVEAIAKLSEADQQVIHLRYQAGLSFRQIADILDQPLGTVLARQHRAVKKLKELLGDSDVANL